MTRAPGKGKGNAMIRNAALVIAAVVLVPLGASAAETQQRIAIEGFRGPGAQRLQGALETGLLGTYYVVPDVSVAQMARRRGVALVGDEAFAEVGRALKVRGFVSADVQRRDGWQVLLTVRRGDTGERLGRFVVADRRLDKLESTLARRAPGRLAALLARPSRETVEASDTSPPAVSESAPPPVVPETKRAGGEDIFELRLEGRMLNRSLSYVQNLSGAADYRLRGAFATALEAAVHPFGLLLPALAPLGITGGLEYGLGIGSHAADDAGRSTSTDVHAYHAGLRYRVGGPTAEVAPTVGYAAQTFRTGGDPDTAPDVDYRVVSLGASGRWAPLPWLALFGRGAYLDVLSSGPITSANRFHRATVRGMESELGVAAAVSPMFEVQLAAGLRRYGFAMNAVPGDAAVAGGAVDQTTWIGLGFGFRPGAARP